MKTKIVLFMGMAFLLCLNPAFAGSVDLNWFPNTENDLKGYNIYYGTTSGQYGSPIPVGNVTAYTIKDLKEGSTYYFAITAVDKSGNESGFTPEVVKSMAVTYSAGDDSPPQIAIESPSQRAKYSTRKEYLNLSGSASDNARVKQVTWRNSRGGSGIAAGTSKWSASGVKLFKKKNIITVTVTDEAGNQNSKTLTVNYSPSRK